MEQAPHRDSAVTVEGSELVYIPRADMDAMVGMAPESLIRTLSEFRHSTFIELAPNVIRVLEPDALRRARW